MVVSTGGSAVLTQGYYLPKKSLGKQKTFFKDTENCKIIFFLGCHKIS